MTTFKSRVTAALNLIKASGKTPVPYIWMSLGINDAIANTNVTTWKAAMTTWFGDLRRAVGTFAPICMTKFMANYSTYNTAIDDLVAANPFVYAFATADLTSGAGYLRDANHWNSAGMAVVAARMESLTLSSIGQFEQYILAQSLAVAGVVTSGSGGTGGTVATPTFSPSAGSYSSTQSVTISCSTSGASIYYTTDGTTPTTSSTLYTGAISVASSETIKALAVKSGSANSSVASATYTISGGGGGESFTGFTWGQLVNASDAGSGEIDIVNGSGGTTGGTSIESIDATQAFKVEIDLTDAPSSLAIVVGLVAGAQDDGNYSWGGGRSFLAAVYQNNTFNTIVSDSAVLHTGPSVSSYPSKFRMTKSGDDVIVSYDFGNTGTFTDEYTVTGALTGKTTIKVKALFAVPTAGNKIKVSCTALVATQVATPTFSPSAGSYGSSQSVTISCSTSGASIYYTTDGTTPTSGSTLYTGALTVSSSVTIKAIGVKAGLTDSSVGSASYVIGGGSFSGSFTNFAWGNLAHASDSGNGVVAYTSGGTPAGAIATTSLDLTQPFQVEILFDNQSNNDAIVVYLDDNNTANFAWNPSLQFINGVYEFGGSLYIPAGGYAATSGGSLTFPTKIRLTKSGNDVIVTSSTDNWATSNPITIVTGGLTGKSTGYVKAIFAAPSAGNAIKVSYRLN